MLEGGLEPPWALGPLAPQASASTNSAIPALENTTLFEKETPPVNETEGAIISSLTAQRIY